MLLNAQTEGKETKITLLNSRLSQQIPYELTWDRKQAAAMRCRQLTD